VRTHEHSHSTHRKSLGGMSSPFRIPSCRGLAHRRVQDLARVLTQSRRARGCPRQARRSEIVFVAPGPVKRVGVEHLQALSRLLVNLQD